jgi:DNA gyrase subunit A
VKRYTAAAHHLSAAQAGAILSMQLQRLTGLEIEKLAKEYCKLAEEIERYEAILASEALILDIIRQDVQEIRDKYGCDRRTQISEAVGEFSLEELIPDEQVVVTITHEGYIKRTDMDSYRKQGRGGRGVRGGDTKEGDFLEYLFVVNTHDHLLVFTDRGRVYWLRVFGIPAMARTARGRSLANLVKMLPNESHRAILPVKQFEESFVFFATARGTVKKTPIAAFSRPRSTGIIAINLDPTDTLINVELTDGNCEVVLGTRDGMAVRFNENDVRAMGRGARGVKGVTLGKDDGLVDMIAIQPGATVLTICEMGFGKRTAIEEYRLTRRGGKGVINIKTTERNGKVVAVRAVNDDDELMLITAKGIMLRTDLEKVRSIGRATQGVRLIRVDAGDRVVAVAKIAKEDANGDDPPTAAPEDASPPSDQPTPPPAETN